MSEYDNWLLNQAEQHTAPCEPKVIAVHLEPQDGEISRENVYNCENCQECNCDYWEEFNDYPELQAEMDEAKLWGI